MDRLQEHRRLLDGGGGDVGEIQQAVDARTKIEIGAAKAADEAVLQLGKRFARVLLVQVALLDALADEVEPLGVGLRAALGAYSWAHYPGVRYAALYWHFLDGVWLILFVALLVTT